MRVVVSVKAVTAMKKRMKMIMSVTSVRVSALTITYCLTTWMK